MVPATLLTVVALFVLATAASSAVAKKHKECNFKTITEDGSCKSDWKDLKPVLRATQNMLGYVSLFSSPPHPAPTPRLRSPNTRPEHSPHPRRNRPGCSTRLTSTWARKTTRRTSSTRRSFPCARDPETYFTSSTTITSLLPSMPQTTPRLDPQFTWCVTSPRPRPRRSTSLLSFFLSLFFLRARVFVLCNAY